MRAWKIHEFWLGTLEGVTQRLKHPHRAFTGGHVLIAMLKADSSDAVGALFAGGVTIAVVVRSTCVHRVQGSLLMPHK